MIRWQRDPFLPLAMVIGLVAMLLLLGYRNARAEPVVRRAAVALPGWPAAARPVTIALIADIHLGSAAMDADRLTQIAAQTDALAPDIVVIAGDFVFGHDPANGARFAAALTRPLSRLHAPLGVFAVLGNHDHGTAPGAVAAALRHAGITVLANTAIERGPLVVVGIDDAFSGHASPGRALAAAGHLRGAAVVVTHSPGAISALPPGSAPLVLAGHTHCGQVVVPWIGALGVYSVLTGRTLFDPRYRCGVVRDPGRTVIVTGGLGTSGAPIRFGAPPDIWLIRVGPSRPRP